MISSPIRSRRFGWIVGAATLAMSATTAHAQQASLILNGSNVALCNHNTTPWTLTKSSPVSSVASGSTVTWTVTATRGVTSDATLEVNGFVKITNGGAAPATIGNIVVNLQKKVGNKWVSAAADVADATNGDVATSAKILASASQEANNPGIYAISGATGSFSETAGKSGKLEFTDATSNTIWSIVGASILGGATQDLVFQAEFNNTALALPVGTQVRAEVIVTFGNSGARGGSGAVGSNIDINGNGIIDLDEKNVRSVPTRITSNVPVLELCNNEVTVTDLGLSTTGTVTTANATGVFGPTIISTTTSWPVSVDVDGGLDGGTVANEAALTSPGTTVSLITGYAFNPLTGLNDLPIYATFPCCEGLDLSASSVVIVEGDLPPDGFTDGQFFTFSQGGFGGPGAPFQLLSSNFAAAFPAGVEVGIPGAGGFSMKFTSAAAVQAYLPAGGAAKKLNADQLNPTSSNSGVIGGQVLALKLNVGLSGVPGATPAGFGNLYLKNTGTSLDGQTVSQILAACETALGGGALPAGYTYSSLSGLAANLNLSFDNTTGSASAWAVSFLSTSP